MNKMPKESQDVYDRLRRDIRGEPDEAIWDELVKRDFVEDALERANGYIDLLKYYKEQRARYRASGHAGRSRLTLKKEPRSRLLADYVVQVLAGDAAHDVSVIDYRHRHLSGTLLTADAAVRWLYERTPGDVPMREYRGEREFIIGASDQEPIEELAFALEDEQVRHWHVKAENTYSLDASALMSDRELNLRPSSAESVAEHEHRQVMYFTIGNNEPLRELAVLSQDLARKYTWAESEAATFVLTGRPPRETALNPIAMAIMHERYPVLSHLIMRVSLRMSPKDVAQAYASFQSDLAKEWPRYAPQKKRQRGMSMKHLELGLFYHNHAHEKGPGRLKAWNKEHRVRHPTWCYDSDSLSNFDRDAKYAYNRIIGKTSVEDNQNGTR